MPATLFTLHLDTELGAFRGLKANSLENLKKLKLAIAERVNNETKNQAKSVAEFALRRMSDTLKPGHKFNVGASGRSSQNFALHGGSSGYFFVWEVTEPSNKPANRFIRWGFSGTRPGKQIPEANIRLWLAQKKIFLRDEQTGKKVSKPLSVYSGPLEDGQRKTTSYFLSKSKRGKKYGRSKNKSVSDPALRAIIRKLSAVGSGGSHWMELYPKNQGRYDYVGYIIQKKGEFMNAMAGVGYDFTTAIVEYLLSGRLPNKFGHIKTGGTTKLRSYNPKDFD